MDFIVEHAGIFICIAIVTLLAIIGYYADKKDNGNKAKEKNFKDKDINDTENKPLNDSSSSIPFSELPDVSVDQNVLDNKVDVIEVDDSSNDNLTNNDGFGINNFENIEMSLEDLEKKNYDNIISKNSDDENFYYSNIGDDSDSNGFEYDFDNEYDNRDEVQTDGVVQNIAPEVEQLTESYTPEFEQVVDNSVPETNQLSDDSIPEFEQVINNSVPEVSDLGTGMSLDSNSDNNLDYTDIVSTDDNSVVESHDNHVFDAEVASDGSESSIESPVDLNTSEIPEIDNINPDGSVNFNTDGASFSSDLTDDDIWKF